MAVTNLGTQYTIGFGSYTVTGLTLESLDLEKTGEVEQIKGEDGATTAVLISDPGTSIRLTGMVKTSGGSTIQALTVGGTITCNGVNYMVLTNSSKYTNKICRVDITARKETSMTYS